MILALAVDEDVTNEKLQYIIDAHRADITRMLRSLCQKGFLISEGIGRGTHYKLSPTFHEDKAKVKAKDQADINAKIKTVDRIPDKVNDKAKDKADDKAKDKADDKADDKAKDKAHRDREIVIQELMTFCSVWRKSSEMARYVGELPQYISRRIIPEMLKRGILIREYPDVPTHPAQRYRVKPKRSK